MSFENILVHVDDQTHLQQRLDVAVPSWSSRTREIRNLSARTFSSLGTGAARRAVSDAMPLLQRAKQVTVLTVNPERGISGHDDIPGADISLNLARHGVIAEAAQTVARDKEVGTSSCLARST